MKRAAIKRTAPLARKTPMKAKRTKPRRVSVVRDEAYKRAIRELGYCCVAESLPNAGPCWGRIECMHLGRRNGMSSKGSDHETAPGCSGHHRDQEADTGVFKGWTDEQMLAWGKEQYLTAGARIAARRRYEKHLARMPEVA